MAEVSALDQTISARRRQTRSSIYRYLYEAGVPCSKQQIAAALGLSLPTVYQNLTELAAAGLIGEAGMQPSSGGRPATQLSILADARLSAGVCITRQRLRFILTDLSRRELGYKDVRHQKDVSDPDYSAFLAAQLERFLDENGVDRGKLLGVGVSLAGVISAESRSILFAPTLALRDVPFSQLLQAIPYPTRLENDGTCGGFAEWFSSPGTRNIAFLSIEDGVGGSVLVNGAQFTGDNGRSGEFGHMCVEPGGLPCKCGRRGCLEAYCSATRLTEVSGVTLREFFLGVECGNSAYRTLLDDYLRHLAIGIHNIRLALDCDVILGGFMAKFLEPYLPQLRDQLAQLDPFDAAGAYLHLSRYPKHAALIGAALYFVKQFLDQV